MRRTFPAPARRAATRGFMLIELMVAMTIGLVVALVVTGTVLTMGRQFKVVGSSVSAQSGAQIALSLIESAGRSAGAGLFNNGQMLCPTLNAWKDGAVKSDGDVFMPARIVDGGSAGASDTITFTASTAAGALSGMPLVDTMASAGASVVVSNAGAIQEDDLALVGAPGSDQPCTLFQVTAAPTTGTSCGGNTTSCKTLQRAVDAATGYNPPDPAAVFAAAPIYGFTGNTGAVPPVHGPAVVNRVGSAFRQQAFAVRCGALIQYDAFSDAPACTSSPLSFSGGANALVTDVVLMHAQYGISASAASDVVTEWVDATGAWASPSAANVGRIKAIRVVVVTRAHESEATNVTAASCDNLAGVLNIGPCSFRDADAPLINVSGVAVPAGRTWRNYRYRAHKAVVPLRNVIWSS